jgi:hypothetical protein
MSLHHRHVLFYSNYCVYSKTIIDSILSKSLRHMFVLVCVDKRTSELPEFVDRVPLVFTVDRRVLTDDAVAAFVDNLALYHTGAFSSSAQYSNITDRSTNQSQQGLNLDGNNGSTSNNNNSPSNPNSNDEEDVCAWSTMEMGSRNISDKFSFLECTDAMAYSHNFVDINGTGQPMINTPPADKNSKQRSGQGQNQGQGEGSGKGSGVTLESLQAQRDSDMKVFFSSRPPPVPV